jgi:sugar/nucleoside kinase (ribokinase family)
MSRKNKDDEQKAIDTLGDCRKNDGGSHRHLFRCRGTQVMADLAVAGIPLLLPRASGEDIGLVEPDDERTFVTSPGAKSRLRPADLNALPLLPGDAIYVSGYDLCYPISGATLEEWLHALHPQNLLVVDPGPLVAEIPSERLAHVLAHTDIVSLNAREIGILTGSTDLPEAAKRLVPRLAPGGWMVARAGAQGCWVASDIHAPSHLPARPTRAVDTTGAGDDMVAAALAANVAASIAVEKIGPATSPTAQELEHAMSH